MKLEFCWQIFEKYSNIKCRGNPSSGSGVVACGRTDRQTDRQTDMTKLTVTFRNSAYKPTGYCCEGYKIRRGMRSGGTIRLTPLCWGKQSRGCDCHTKHIDMGEAQRGCLQLSAQGIIPWTTCGTAVRPRTDRPLAAFIQAHHHIPAPKHVSAAHKLLIRHTPGVTNRHVPDCNTLRHAATRMGSRMSRVPTVLRRSVAFLISSKKRSKSKVLNSNSAPSFVLPDPLPITELTLCNPSYLHRC